MIEANENWYDDCMMVKRDVDKIVDVNFVNYLRLQQICYGRHRRENFCDCCNECVKCKNKKLIKQEQMERELNLEIIKLIDKSIIDNDWNFTKKSFENFWKIAKVFCLVYFVGYYAICEKCIRQFVRNVENSLGKHNSSKLRTIMVCIEWFGDDDEKEILRKLNNAKKKIEFKGIINKSFIEKYKILIKIIRGDFKKILKQIDKLYK